MHLFCFGIGYVAKVISSELGKRWKVSGSHTGKREVKTNEYIFNDNVKFDLNSLQDITHILISIPPGDGGDPVFLSYLEQIKNLPKLEWIGYFSATSVYGDHQGGWVTEETEADSLSGKKRLMAEEQWLGSSLPVNILRLSAIYGHGRSAIETILSGKAIRVFKENHYFSRIHVKDISQIIQIIMDNPKIGEVYNIADDLPSAQHEVISYGCELLNIDPPEMVNVEEANLSEAMLRYYSVSKRVSNNKIKNTYNLNLLFPSYKEGLKDCIKNLGEKT
ncbi:MAG: SDR family oxidoreductase [Rickettsiales bacterium]|jgi:nucleoside-diphosphate-sugar epimerase|nr:SDR family oxidoreductase [Rickettsiales bacterium]